MLAVGIGGAAGSLARAAVAVGLPHEAGTWAWSTFVVNATGCFVLAALLVVLPPRRPYARLLIGTGVLGGYTTFSAFSVDVVQLLDRGRTVMAGAYVVASVVVMLAAALAGRRAAGSLIGRATP